MSEFLFGSELLRVLQIFPRLTVTNLARPPEHRLVVVDSNVLIRAARQAMKLRNPRATTTLEEIAKSGVWTLIAPRLVEHEVRRALEKRPHVAAKLEAAVQRVLGCVRFVDVPPQRCLRSGPFTALAERDPTDLPYVWLLEFAAADFIVSADKDLAASGFPVLKLGPKGFDAPLKVRDHARLVADAHGRVIATAAGGYLVAAALRGVVRWLGPTGTLLAAVGATIGWRNLSDDQKRRIAAKVDELRPQIKRAIDFLRPAAHHYAAAVEAERLIAKELPQRRALQLGDRVFRLALIGRFPPSEIAARLNREDGGRLSPDSVMRVARTDSRLHLGETISVSSLVSPPSPSPNPS
ncbi:MAG: hypothetical protein U0228_25495 [Myxococcaceae bacterium]